MPPDIPIRKVEELLALYKEKRRLLTSHSDWQCYDFLENPEEFDPVEALIDLGDTIELSEQQKISLLIYDEVISDLEELLKNGPKTQS
jgi:hypothetical protein